MSDCITIKVSGRASPFLFDDTLFVRQEIASRVWVSWQYDILAGMRAFGDEPLITSFTELIFGKDILDSHSLHFLNKNTQDFRAENIQLVPHKRRHLGDVREDGMVFWEFSPHYPKGEHWITLERFQELFPRVKSEGSVFKRGDFNFRGSMCLSIKDGKPVWVSLHSWDAKQAARKKKREEWKASPPERKLRSGDIREDGMVFVSYNPDSRNGEYWTTPEKYQQIKQSQREYAKKNPEKTREYALNRYYKDHESNKARSREKSRERYRRDPEASKKKSREYSKKRREEDVVFAIITRVRSRLRMALKGIGKKSKRTHAILGISYEGFASHIESLFLPGMSWENRDKWHLDHLVPLALAETEWDVYLLNHYTNLRPLWGADNLAKSASVPDELPENIHAPIREFWEAKKKSIKNPLPTINP